MAELHLCKANSKIRTPRSGLAKGNSRANAAGLPREAGRYTDMNQCLFFFFRRKTFREIFLFHISSTGLFMNDI